MPRAPRWLICVLHDVDVDHVHEPGRHDVQLGCRDENEDADSGAAQQKKRSKVFEEHLSFSAMNNGVKAGRLFQSSLRVNRFNPYEGWATHSAMQKVRGACV